MIGGALKLGLAAGLGYTFGGDLGTKALDVVKSDASANARIGAAWGGRIATFLALSYVLGKV